MLPLVKFHGDVVLIMPFGPPPRRRVLQFCNIVFGQPGDESRESKDVVQLGLIFLCGLDEQPRELEHGWLWLFAMPGVTFGKSVRLFVGCVNIK